MNDIEIIELIKGTELATFSIPRLGESTIQTDELKPMVKAWEKQLPIKVIHNKSRNEYDCPSCKKYIKEDEYFGYPISDGENFCKECGQALDWE